MAIPDENNLPVQYKVTLRGRETLERDPDANVDEEKFLLYQDQDMMVFMAATDIEVVHSSEILVADGTFEMVPKQYSQLYTIHGFKNGEGEI